MKGVKETEGDSCWSQRGREEEKGGSESHSSCSCASETRSKEGQGEEGQIDRSLENNEHEASIYKLRIWLVGLKFLLAVCGGKNNGRRTCACSSVHIRHLFKHPIVPTSVLCSVFA
jgi:hypothetical protein